MKNKGYILVEKIVTMVMFLFILLLMIRYVNLFFKVENKANLSNYSNDDIISTVIESIRLRDISKNDIYISNKEIIYKKDKVIVKLEFKNNYLYFSGKKLSKFDNIEFYKKNNLLIIYVFKNNMIEERVLRL